MTKRKALVDIAYDILSKKRKPMPFKNLWDDVVKVAELDETSAKSKLGQLYGDMSLDPRFIQQAENKWDLKKHYKFEDTYRELQDSDDEGDEEEEKEFLNEEEDEENINREEEEDDY